MSVSCVGLTCAILEITLVHDTRWNSELKLGRMIKLPPYPFKETDVDDSHPFVANALRDRKHYEPCWCGSGKKYKKCHRLREQEKPYTIGQLQNLQRKVFWRRRGCMHPLASSKSCSGKVIDSHTIQRKGPLKRIIDDTGHLMHFEFDTYNSEVKASRIGWRKASIFPGYCSGHDTSLFAPIEKGEFSGEHWHNVLYAFRNVCNELYRKQALIEAIEFQRSVIDRGFDLDRQINVQLSLTKNIEGQKKSLEENKSLREKFESAITQRQFDAFESKCYFFQGNIEVVSSSVFQCEFDFNGNKLLDMWDLNMNAEMLSHSVINTEDGGAIIFVWLKDQKDPSGVINSFDKLSDVDKGDIFVQYCFINCENTYFSIKWWLNLSQNQQALIKNYANALYYEGGAFTANRDRLVNWVFV